MRECLRGVSDLERLTNRLLIGKAGPRDLLALKQSLDSVPVITELIEPIPALVAVNDLLRPLLERPMFPLTAPLPRPHLWLALIAAGAVLQAAVFAFPAQMYPFVWIAPFLIVDGLLERTGNCGLVHDLLDGRWRDAARIVLAGLACGVLWEFWNFWSMPKWEYDVPLLGFWKVFEMPLLGYGGYIPFAWSILQFVRLVDVAKGRVVGEG